MWQTKYALTVPKNLGVRVNFRPCSEDYYLSGHLWVLFGGAFDLQRLKNQSLSHEIILLQKFNGKQVTYHIHTQHEKKQGCDPYKFCKFHHTSFVFTRFSCATHNKNISTILQKEPSFYVALHKKTCSDCEGKFSLYITDMKAKQFYFKSLASN